MTTEKRWKKLHEVKQKSFVGVKTLTKRKQQKKLHIQNLTTQPKELNGTEGKKMLAHKKWHHQNKNRE